jgi:hypothetical protein
MRQRVAILCCHTGSHYHSMRGVECYDIRRDVRTFMGGMPVVAHPPCRAWSAKCSHQAKPEPGEKELGPLCVEWLRKCGGVLEHPAGSRLWAHLALPVPGREAGGLWCVEVLQSWWGNAQLKRTWLLFSGVDHQSVRLPRRLAPPLGNRRRWQLLSRKQRSATCPRMAQWLVNVAARSIIHPPSSILA